LIYENNSASLNQDRKARMMKKFIYIILMVVCLTVSLPVWAEERIVQLNLSGCADCNATDKMKIIMKKTKGVKKHEYKGHGLLVVTFNDEITTLNIIISQLKRGKLFVEGEPIFLK
jgi:hypothetical protein